MMGLQAVGLCNEMGQQMVYQYSHHEHSLAHLISVWQNLLHKLLFDGGCMGQVNLIELHNQTKLASACCVPP